MIASVSPIVMNRHLMNINYLWFYALKCQTAFALVLVLLLNTAKTNAGQTADNMPLPKGETGTIVFLDSSVSMKGYFKKEGKLPNFHVFLQNDFRDVLSSYKQLEPLDVSLFGTSVTTPKQVKGFMFTPDDFPELNTDIIAVFRSEWIESHLLSIVITDGVQSDAAGGFNKGEMTRVIRERMDAGWHLYLVSAKMEFDGYVYSEIHRISGQKQQAIRHNGVRPIYFWLATRHEHIGEEVALAIMSELKTVVADESLVGMVDFNHPEQPTINSLSIPQTSKYHAARRFKKEPPSYEIKLYEPKKQSQIEIPIKIDLLDEAWAITMAMDVQSEPSPLQWAKMEYSSEKKLWNLILDYRIIPSEKKHSLKINVNATFRSEGHWWSTWSTADDISPENADKTLYLDKLAWGLLQPLYAESKTVSSLDLMLQKKTSNFGFYAIFMILLFLALMSLFVLRKFMNN